jgi:DNA-binding CsgD family transcriptional regulator
MQINQHGKNLEWRVNVLEHSLSQLGQGIILLSSEGKVLFVTELAKDALLKNDGIVLQQDKLVALIERDNANLQETIALTMNEHLVDKAYKNIYIHRHDALKPYLLLISKIQFDSNGESFEDDGVLILIKDTHANIIYWQERLRSKYSLTKREAYLTVLLTEGRTIKEIGAVMEIAEATARQYLKNCYKKMQVQKQHELVCLALDCSRKR